MYAPTINNQRLTFHAECVWRRNMVIRDEETGSLWQHATGEALAGPLKGQRLSVLPGSLLTLGAWKEMYPTSLIALPPEQWTGLVPLDKVKIILERATRSGIVPGLSRQDQRLAANAPIIGLAYQGSARAYPLALLEKQGVIQDMLQDQPVTISFDSAARMVSLDSPTKDQIIFRRTWWNGWYEFYPHTDIFQLSATAE